MINIFLITSILPLEVNFNYLVIAVSSFVSHHVFINLLLYNLLDFNTSKFFIFFTGCLDVGDQISTLCVEFDRKYSKVDHFNKVRVVLSMMLELLQGMIEKRIQETLQIMFLIIVSYWFLGTMHLFSCIPLEFFPVKVSNLSL